ncbi:MAG: acetoin utilization protein AcuC [Deltaproteobacteria bacterium]|nr:acetoin utilization protein AcuC [Deltaproteobacteria bacterium]MBW2083183.1 acetoin utilization protein AcuC [Deltaproteobacteria bacterium]HDM09625.1 acetoin utilization protein AcuC [Desulfobacteraceae bacterium]
MKTAFIYTNKYLKYTPPDNYPWSVRRAEATYNLCKRLGLLDHPWITVHQPSPLAQEALYNFHTKAYVSLLKEANDGHFKEEWLRYGLGTTECPVYKGVYEYNLLTAGATMDGAKLVKEGHVERAFNVCGGFHHAGKDFAAGFCYINDVVLAIKSLLSHYTRVMYVDIDAHHGDQVQQAFYSTDRVLTISFHQDPKTLFPFEGGDEKEAGRGKGRGYCINVPMAPGTGDDEFLWAFGEIFVPAAGAYKPGVVVAVTGVDGLATDPLSNLKLTTKAYTEAVEIICRYSPKLLVLGGGGYSLEHSSAAWTLLWATINGLGCSDEDMVSFGGAFWGDGICSLQSSPIFVSEKERKQTRNHLSRVVRRLKNEVLSLIK